MTPLQESELNLNEFECYLSLSGRRGVLLYIHKSIEALETTSEKKQYKDSVWCTVSLNKNDKLLVGCVYRSPSSTADENECLNKVILEAPEYKASHKLIMGDFNHPEIDWHTQTCQQSQAHPACKFLEVINDNFLYQHSLEPTHSRPGQTANILNIILANEEDMIADLKQTTPLGKS